MIINSYAKLNLYLRVLNKRKDDYHNIQTLFERINLSDKIILHSRRDKEIKIVCKNPSVPKDSSNLCYRSVKLLQEAFNINSGLDIKIIKHIPVGAGLGGGSSNAACVLMGLNKLWKLGLSQNRLAKLGARIGSDVPFFVYNTPFAQGKGRGEKIKPLRMLKTVRLWHILVVPRIKVPTPLIYERWDTFLPKHSSINLERAGLTKLGDNVKIITSALRKNNLSLISNSLFNSLEKITIKLYPQVKEIKEKLANLGLKSILMSGSGPAVFGIVSSGKEAVSLSRKLKQTERPWRVFVTRTI